MRILKKRNVVITGATGGIGSAIIKLFGQEGANIWACARKPNPEFEKWLSQTASACNVLMRPVYFDLAVEEEVKKGIRSIVRERKGIDILVNNAGMPYAGMIASTPIDKLRDVMEINFISQILITQLISRTMIRARSGVILNIGSIGGIEGREGYLAYGSSKAALMWATKVMAKEYGHYGIRVNALAPGLTHTTMGQFKTEDDIANIIESQCIKRMASPIEIAQAALFLASDQSSYITGTVLNVDGGRII